MLRPARARRGGRWSLRTVFDLFPALEARADSGGTMLSGASRSNSSPRSVARRPRPASRRRRRWRRATPRRRSVGSPRRRGRGSPRASINKAACDLSRKGPEVEANTATSGARREARRLDGQSERVLIPAGDAASAAQSPAKSEETQGFYGGRGIRPKQRRLGPQRPSPLCRAGLRHHRIHASALASNCPRT